jgi:hypothetical protein
MRTAASNRGEQMAIVEIPARKAEAARVRRIFEILG